MHLARSIAVPQDIDLEFVFLLGFRVALSLLLGFGSHRLPPFFFSSAELALLEGDCFHLGCDRLLHKCGQLRVWLYRLQRHDVDFALEGPACLKLGLLLLTRFLAGEPLLRSYKGRQGVLELRRFLQLHALSLSQEQVFRARPRGRG